MGKLDYLQGLAVSALWISPIFKQVSFEETYHGYGIQNFLEVDRHLGSREDLVTLVRAAHQKGILVVLDVILNHTGDVFTYVEGDPVYDGNLHDAQGFNDASGQPTIPAAPPDKEVAWPDGGVWPTELFRPETFGRKGRIANWENYPEYVQGDFFSLKNVQTGEVTDGEFRPSEALKVLTECYKYWIALADIDGYRLDTVKHLEPGATAYFTREIHEFVRTIGKENFYVIGEVTGGLEFAIDMIEQTGLDAALGINMVSEKLESVAKGYENPQEYFGLFRNTESLGEAENTWYKDNVITTFDDHDMVAQTAGKSRFCADEQTRGQALHLREVSYDGGPFEIPHRIGEGRHSGIVAWSRIHSTEEVLLAINCHTAEDRTAQVVVDGDLEGTFRCVCCSKHEREGEILEVHAEPERSTVTLTVPTAGCAAYIRG